MISIIKLSTGEEIVGEIDEAKNNDPDFVLVSNPLKIMYQPTTYGSPNTYIARYMMFGKGNQVALHSKHVVAVCEPRDSFVVYYKKAVEQYQKTEEDIDHQLKDATYDEDDLVEDIFTNILKKMPKGSLPN